MLKKIQKFQDAIFLITQEKSCPMYNIGEEIKIANSGLSVAGHKPGCLYLSKKVATISGSKESIGGIPKITRKNEVFNCGGCEAGIIHFEYKKDKDFATLQMKLLTESEEKRKKQHLEKFFHILRKLEIFEPLDNDALTDLTLLLDLKNIPVDKVVVKKGDWVLQSAVIFLDIEPGSEKQKVLWDIYRGVLEKL